MPGPTLLEKASACMERSSSKRQSTYLGYRGYIALYTGMDKHMGGYVF